MRLNSLTPVLALSAGLLFLSALSGCGSTPAATPAESVVVPVEAEFEQAVSRDGNYLLSWRPAARADVPVNEHFEIEAYIVKTASPEKRLQDVRVVVSAWMPGHGHGMVTKPKATASGDGTYLVKGMLFHMGGYWQLFFDVLEGQTAERIEFELNL